MGQKWSAIRNWGAVVTSSPTILERLTHDVCASIPDIAAVEELDRIKQQGPMDEISDMHAISAIVVGPASGTLLDMPSEILHEIISYLSPSSTMSLSYACRKLYEQLGLSIEEVLRPILQTKKPSLNRFRKRP